MNTTLFRHFDCNLLGGEEKVSFQHAWLSFHFKFKFRATFKARYTLHVFLVWVLGFSGFGVIFV